MFLRLCRKEPCEGRRFGKKPPPFALPKRKSALASAMVSSPCKALFGYEEGRDPNMASWMIHLRIADELRKQLRPIDETAFVMGNIAPDSGVPNSSWTEFHPPKTVTHFYKKTESGRVIDVDSFCRQYFSESLIRAYSLREYSFFLGYYIHLLTDVRWSEEILSTLKRDHPAAYAEDKRQLIETAKEDWYDLDFLYLEKHPDFPAFSVYENAAGFDNDLMDMFARNAFDDRRQYICGFYRSGEHGDLHREYRYLTQERADAFVKDTSAWLLKRAALLPVPKVIDPFL